MVYRDILKLPETYDPPVSVSITWTDDPPVSVSITWTDDPPVSVSITWYSWMLSSAFFWVAVFAVYQAARVITWLNNKVIIYEPAENPKIIRTRVIDWTCHAFIDIRSADNHNDLSGRNSGDNVGYALDMHWRAMGSNGKVCIWNHNFMYT